MAKLFVSYSRKDSVIARKIIDALKALQQDVWVDWEDIPPAVDWLEQIFRGIEGSDAFIFLVSPDSIASEVCSVEIGRAKLNNKRIIPVVLRDVAPQTTNEIIRKLNWTFMREADDFDAGIEKIKTAIDLDLDWLEEHNRLQLRALEWHRKKEPSLLLRGRDLRNAQQMVLTAGSKDPIPTELQKTYILHSSRSERNRIAAWIATGIALVIMVVLSSIAFQERRQAISNAITANQYADQANKNAEVARNNEQAARKAQSEAETARQQAEDARVEAEQQKKVAEAQRSAAQAQIFQSMPGGLYISTLLAIDSWQKSRSPEAEEILRENISLLPRPVAQVSQAGNINSLMFNPNGKTFLTASADGTACLWNAEDGKKLFCVTSPKSENDAVFSPDGKFIVTGDESGLVQILDAENGSVQNKYSLNVPIRKVNIRPPNGQLLAIAREDGKITIVDLRTRQITFPLQTSGRLNVSGFSPNGTWFAVGSSTGVVTLWNLNDGKIITGLKHKGEVLALAFSPNNKIILTGGKDSAAVISEITTGKELLRIPNENWVRDVAFSPDGLWFVTVSDDKRIRVWDTASGKERLRMLQDSVVTEVKVSSNGQWIATTGSDKTVRVWNAATGAEIFQIPLEASGSVLAFNKDGNYLVSSDQSGKINVWDISVMAAPEKSIQFNGLVGNIQFSPLENQLAASDENRAWLLNPEQLSSRTARPPGLPILQLKSKVKQLIFSPNSKLLGVFTEGNEVPVYNIENRGLKTLKVSSAVQAIAFSPDSLQFITGDSDGNVEAWDVNSTELLGNLSKANSKVLSMAASSNLLAIGLRDNITVLDVTSKQTVVSIAAPGDHPLLAFSTDGSLLASSNSSGQIKIWKYQNSEFSEVVSLNKQQPVSLSFNSKGNLLAIGTANYAYLIDPTTGEEIARIPHIDIVNAVSFSADGKILATASARVIQFWDIAQIEPISKDNLIEVACSRIPENFSDARWSSLLTLCENLTAP